MVFVWVITVQVLPVQTSHSCLKPRWVKRVIDDVCFHSLPVLAKLFCAFFPPVAAFTISFLLPLRLLSVFIKMKGSFDVRF